MFGFEVWQAYKKQFSTQLMDGYWIVLTNEMAQDRIRCDKAFQIVGTEIFSDWNGSQLPTLLIKY